ncbi:MAG: hypothetical protein FWG65_03600 [Turicibacter sp.]|nr:hypothetical protein [Turicibacter sp.]
MILQKFRKNTPKKGASLSNMDKKYYSLMLVPSYTSGKTRSIRISDRALYMALFIVPVMILAVSLLAVRSNFLRQVADDVHYLLHEAETAYTDLREITEEEQSILLEDVIAVQTEIYEQLERSEENLREQHLTYVHSLETLWMQTEFLEERLRENELYRLKVIEQLAENDHIPAISTMIDSLYVSQEPLLNILEELLSFTASVREETVIVQLAYVGAETLAPLRFQSGLSSEDVARDLFYYIEMLDIALEAQEELFYQLERQINAAIPIIRRDRYGPRLIDWSQARNTLPRNTPVMITDVRTGITYWMNIFSMGNHADAFAVSAADTATVLRTFNGRWSWNTRPIWVHVGDRKYAASINGMPHAGGPRNGNNMNGHLCIHFRGSRTHSGSRTHERDHQNSVMEAYRAFR